MGDAAVLDLTIGNGDDYAFGYGCSPNATNSTMRWPPAQAHSAA